MFKIYFFLVLGKVRSPYGIHIAPYRQVYNTQNGGFLSISRISKKHFFEQALVGTSVQALQALPSGRRDICWNFSQKKFFGHLTIIRGYKPGSRRPKNGVFGLKFTHFQTSSVASGTIAPASYMLELFPRKMFFWIRERFEALYPNI